MLAGRSGFGVIKLGLIGFVFSILAGWNMGVKVCGIEVCGGFCVFEIGFVLHKKVGILR